MFEHRGTLVGVGLGLVLLAAQSAPAFKLISFNGKPARWDVETIPFTIDRRGSADFKNGGDGAGPCVSEFEAIRRSFATWASAEGVELSFREKSPKAFAKTGYDGENTLIFTESGWTALSFAPPPEALAVTISTYTTEDNIILDSDIHFNGEYFRWGVIDTQEEEMGGAVVDIQNIATHEIGHFIGIDHSSEDIYETNESLYLATMFFASGPGEIFRRELHDDDLLAVRHIYPVGRADEPVVEEVSPNRIDTYQGSAVVRITGANFGAETFVVIATEGDRGDVVGKVVAMDASYMDVVFDVYGMKSGRYDVVVSNAYNAAQRVEGALEVQGSDFGYDGNGYGGYASESSGGCSLTGSGSLASALFMLILPLLLIGWSRSSFAARKKESPR